MNYTRISADCHIVPSLIVSGLSEADRAKILGAAGPDSRIVEVKDSASQRRELPDTEIIFGRVHPDNFSLAPKLRLYHSIGAGGTTSSLSARTCAGSGTGGRFSR